MKIFFADSGLARKTEAIGFAEHDRGIREALRRAGALVDCPEHANFALWVGPADLFKPTPGIKNVLFTATESSVYPEDQITPDIQKADILLVPCEHNKKVMEKIHPNVAVVPLGVSPDDFPFHQRKEPTKDEPFRFLFVGNLHWLKGAPLLIDAFKRWGASGSMPRNCELYIKTSNAGTRAGKPFRGLSYSILKDREFVPTDEPGDVWPRIVVNNSYLSTEDLRRIYETAHCFVAPAYGEGWGLCITEAMSTGAPTITTGWSAMVDYSDDTTAYLLRPGDWRLGPVPWNHLAGNVAHVRPDRLIHVMRSVSQNYPEALERGKRASERVHTLYTWDQAGKKLIRILEEIR